MRPITIKIARAISFPKVKVSCIRVAHLTLAQFMNMVSAKTKKNRIVFLQSGFMTSCRKFNKSNVPTESIPLVSEHSYTEFNYRSFTTTSISRRLNVTASELFSKGKLNKNNNQITGVSDILWGLLR